MTSLSVVMGLTFGILRSAPGAPSPVFLSLFDPRIPCQETRFLKNIFELRIVLQEGFRNPVADGDRLARNASSSHIHRDVKLVSSSREFKGLKDDHLTGLSSEIFFHAPFVNDKLSLSGFEPHPRDGCLPFACCVNRFCHFSSPPHERPAGRGRTFLI